MDRPVVTLRELQTVYSLQDLYDMVEVHMVNRHNQALVDKAAKRKGRRDV